MHGNAELLSEYARDQRRRGPAPAGSHTGSAGGSVCGDLVRISLRVEDGRDRRGVVRRRGLRGASCLRRRGVRGGRGRAGAARPPRSPPMTSRALVGGLGPQGRHAAELVADALARALSALASSGEPIARGARRERVLVAVSGGVDSAVAALLERERGAEVVAVTLKLWADERTDGTQACCSPEAVRGARSLCHSLGIPHLTLDLEDAFRREVVGAFVGGYRAGETPNPCVICNGDLRIDAMVVAGRPARRLGASRPVITRASTTTARGRSLRGAADPAKDQTYMLSGLRPETLARLRFPLGELTKPEVRALAADRAASRSPPSARARTSASSRARASARSSSATAGSPTGPARSWTRRARSSGEHPGHHHFTVGQRRGLGVATGEPVYVTGTDAERNRVDRRRRGRTWRGPRVRLRGARLHRDSARAGPGQAPLPRAGDPVPGVRRGPRASTPSSSSSWLSPRMASRRDRPPAFTTATWSSGARRSPAQR